MSIEYFANEIEAAVEMLTVTEEEYYQNPQYWEEKLVQLQVLGEELESFLNNGVN